MTVPRWMAATAVAAGLAIGSAGIVMAASSSLSSSGSDDVPQVSASPESTPSPSPSASLFPDDSPSPSPSGSIGDDVPADVVAGLSEIPQSAAVAAARAAVGGSAGQVERAVLKVEDGRLVWDVRFTNGSKVEVEAFTGQAVKVDVRGSGSSGSGGSSESGDDNGGNRGRGGDDEPGDDNGGNRGRGGDDEPGDDNGGNRGRGGDDD